MFAIAAGSCEFELLFALELDVEAEVEDVLAGTAVAVDGRADAEEGCARVGAAAVGDIVAGCWAGLRAILIISMHFDSAQIQSSSEQLDLVLYLARCRKMLA